MERKRGEVNQVFGSQGILFREAGQGTTAGLGGQQIQVRVLTFFSSPYDSIGARVVILATGLLS